MMEHQIKKKNIDSPEHPSAQPISPAPLSSPSIASSGVANIFLKVHLYSTLEVRHTTTINVPPDMVMSEVLEIVSRKRKITSKDYMLTLIDMKTEVSLDRNVESLQGVTELCLVKRNQGTSGKANQGFYANPLRQRYIGGDIFMQRQEGNEVVESAPAPSTEYTSVYKVLGLVHRADLSSFIAFSL
jgi:hypothetical protein